MPGLVPGLLDPGQPVDLVEIVLDDPATMPKVLSRETRVTFL